MRNKIQNYKNNLTKKKTTLNQKDETCIAGD